MTSIFDALGAVAALDGTDVEKVLAAADGDLDGLAQLLAQVRSAAAQLGVVDALICERIRPLVPFNGRAVEEVGRVALKGGGSWAYDNAKVRPRLAASIADEVCRPEVDPETGEMVPIPPGTMVARAVEKALAAAGAGTDGFKGWRKGELEERGIDLSSKELRYWRETGEPSVVIE